MSLKALLKMTLAFSMARKLAKILVAKMNAAFAKIA
jgi:hypothetical protein